jgi:hypothetical protein
VIKTFAWGRDFIMIVANQIQAPILQKVQHYFNL